MMVPPIATTAFVVASSALFTCPRCALESPVQCRVRGRGRYRYRIAAAAAAAAGDDIDSEQTGEHAGDAHALEEEGAAASTSSSKKPQSRLAMAAADWLEEDDGDELAMYWDRFDAAKAAAKSGGDRKKEQAEREVRQEGGMAVMTNDDDDEIADNASTEELLERYHESRGINKEEERKYGPQIEEATRAAGCASSASEAIRILEAFRPYLQYNTKLGGNAYLELAQALDANEDVDAATDIYLELATSPHGDIRRQAREMLARGDGCERPKRQYKRGIWEMLWDGWGD